MEQFKQNLLRSFKQVKNERVENAKCSACGQKGLNRQSSVTWNAVGSFLKCHACGHVETVNGGKNG